ncbi:hypothetical protein Dda_5050 [Drechslerella dactyloides]|uniref:Uncharacterized protein n=1 Tax=Drechslerella dactyloides TaxID=74499 RepID=A0AAD6IY21_DREDA|nr:hypothetical protein Dda_5050 [Drechslerella dactyloides]
MSKREFDSKGVTTELQQRNKLKAEVKSASSVIRMNNQRHPRITMVGRKPTKPPAQHKENQS